MVTTDRRNVEHLRSRHLAGEPVNLADVFRVARLSPPEQRVVCERLAGRSYGQIAADRFRARLPRQPLKKAERRPCRRLGLTASIEQAIHASERIDRGLALAERSRRV